MEYGKNTVEKLRRFGCPQTKLYIISCYYNCVTFVLENTCGTWYTRLIRIHLKYSIAETYINGYIILQRSVRRNPIESLLAFVMLQKKRTTKRKRKYENIENSKDNNKV